MSEFRRRPLLLCLAAVLSLILAAFGWWSLAPADATTDADQTASVQPAAYVWSATRSGTMLRLRGFVPSEDDRRTVLGMVKAHFADLEVEDRLKITEGSPPPDQWLGAVSFGLKQLAHLKQGSARLLNSGFKIEGEARTAADYDELKKALSGGMPTGLSLMNENVHPPLAKPYVFAAVLGPSMLTLSGSVPSESTRKLLRDLARQLFERPTLDDQLQLASGTPNNWKNAVEAALRALSRLDSGKISLSGVTLTIEGVAPDKGTAVAVSYQLKQDLPALFSSSENITWKAADMSSNIGELIAPRVKAIEGTGPGLTTGSIPPDLEPSLGSE